MSFEKNKYIIVKNAISYELANFCLNYFLLKKDTVKFVYDNNIVSQTEFLGRFNDPQVPGSYSHYSDFVMETLLVKLLPLMKEKTKLNLIPSYSYARIYQKGNELKRHKDRSSCEISTTLNLGGDPWPIYINPNPMAGYVYGPKEGKYEIQSYQPTNDKGIEINLDVGDMLIYRGCELEHWREVFEKDICGQVFLHYNDSDGPNSNKNLYDNRLMLGLPRL